MASGEMTLRKWNMLKLINRAKKGLIDSEIWYQRGKVWSNTLKSSFIDSIIRGFIVPTIYVNVINSGKDTEYYEVVDGKQRINALVGFWNQEFKLGKESDDLGLKNKAYSQIPRNISEDKFDDRDIFVVEIEAGEEKQITELFRRLQLGSRLTSPEVLNSIPGNMRSFCKKLTEHNFFSKTALKTSRYSLLQVAAQISLLCIKGVQNTKYSDLKSFFMENNSFDSSSADAKKVESLIDLLDKIFEKDCPEIRNRAAVISIAVLLNNLAGEYVIKGFEKDIAKFYLDFLLKLDREVGKGSSGDARMLAYNNYVIQAADSARNIRERNKILEEELFYSIPKIVPKDPKRAFSLTQRVAIYRKADGKCQGPTHVGDREIPWEKVTADHIVPHNLAGSTTVENGQLMCGRCNSSKGARV